MDGKVTDEAWLSVEPYTNFIQTDPIEGAPASERTEVRVLFDKSTLYIGVTALRLRTGQDHRHAEPARRRHHRVGRDHRRARHVQRQPERVRLRHQSDRHRVRRPGGGRRPDQRDLAESVRAPAGRSAAASARSTPTGMATGSSSRRSPSAAGRPRSRFRSRRCAIRPAPTRPGASTSSGTSAARTSRCSCRRCTRGFDIFRVSSAAKLTGLNLPPRRDVKLIPYVLGSANKDYTFATDQLDNKARAGLDVKWGVRPNLTADFTVNTDFAQVEADEEQVNLTRFDLFFPEKRPFFLENASIFQFGAAQQAELFFSRRIGLSATGASGVPIDIFGGGRLSGKVGGYNVGILDMQTEAATDARTGRAADARQQLRRRPRAARGGAVELRRHLREPRRHRRAGRSTATTTAPTASTRRCRSRPTASCSRISRGPIRRRRKAARTIRAACSTTSPTTSGRCRAGFTQVGDFFNPEVGYLPAARLPPARRSRASFSRSRSAGRGSGVSRRTSATTPIIGLDDGEIQSSKGHYHFFEIQPRAGRTVRHLRRAPAGPARHPVHRLQRRRQARRHPARVLHLASPSPTSS